MKIKNLSEKLIIQSLFYDRDSTGQFIPKQIPLEKIPQAIRLKRKIIDGAKEIKNPNGIVSGYELTNKPVEINEEETELVKEWLQAKPSWTIEEAEVVLELKERLQIN